MSLFCTRVTICYNNGVELPSQLLLEEGNPFQHGMAIGFRKPPACIAEMLNPEVSINPTNPNPYNPCKPPKSPYKPQNM